MSGEPPAELGADEALVIFTSGSTGTPKGVVLSHQAFTEKLSAINSVLPFSAGEENLHVLHANFSFGQWTSLLTLATGGTLRLVRRFNAVSVLQQLVEHRVAKSAVVPSMLRLLVRELEDEANGELAKELAERGSPALWISGGEPLSSGLGGKLRRLMPGSGMADVFGLSESSTSDFILTPDRYDAESGTLGRPSPGVTYKVADGNGAEAGPGQVGELCISTPYLMTGYMGDPGATSEAIQEGWLHTGDLATVGAEDGLVRLVGRAKHLISRGGIKISPLEIEDCFSAHPECVASLAVGIPDEIMGERIELFFVAARQPLPSADELRRWAKSRLEAYKLPDIIHFLDALPQGRTGKIDRISARRMAEEIRG
ncbi:long-chain fatty acid--CoA ligase [Streptacidiphilus sp. 4-A2]|nr:long-chain fatty acid--CoA ligase [Streptacidiphilus sp. 4-A2]